jgi:hypothetical protein
MNYQSLAFQFFTASSVHSAYCTSEVKNSRDKVGPT